MRNRCVLAVLAMVSLASVSSAQTNPLWREEKVKNYLPHMTSPEVGDLLTRTDMVLIPVPSIEQHALHGPMGTDFYSGIETAKLIAQRTDILVAPILMVGQAGYHMEFPGTITLSSETLQAVYFEAAKSLIQHGVRRFVFFNSHQGNQYMTKFVVDRINQETAAVAIDLEQRVASGSHETHEPRAERVARAVPAAEPMQQRIDVQHIAPRSRGEIAHGRHSGAIEGQGLQRQPVHARTGGHEVRRITRIKLEPVVAIAAVERVAALGIDEVVVPVAAEG